MKVYLVQIDSFAYNDSFMYKLEAREVKTAFSSKYAAEIACATLDRDFVREWAHDPNGYEEDIPSVFGDEADLEGLFEHFYGRLYGSDPNEVKTFGEWRSQMKFPAVLTDEDCDLIRDTSTLQYFHVHSVQEIEVRND